LSQCVGLPGTDYSLKPSIINKKKANKPRETESLIFLACLLLDPLQNQRPSRILYLDKAKQPKQKFSQPIWSKFSKQHTLEFILMSISSHSREAFDHVYAWLKKEPWKSRFQDYFNETLTELAEYHEMELDGFVAQARLDGWESQMMSGILEYFAELSFDKEPHNVVDDYLKRRGWKETSIGREYLQELRKNSFQIYQVQSVMAGVSLTIRDVIVPDSVLNVPEVLGSKVIQVDEFVLAKVVYVQDTPYFTGSLYRLNPEDVLEWIEIIEGIIEAEAISLTDTQAVQEMYHELGIELLGDAFAYFIHPLPIITNTDGHLYLYSEIRFLLLQEPEIISQALDGLADMERDHSEQYTWIWYDPKRSSKNELTALGTVKLTPKRLKADVNSKERAEIFIKYMQQVLPKALGSATVTYQSVKSLLQEPQHSTQPELNLSAEETQEVVHASLDAQYRQLLGQPIPMLNHQSPKDAIQTASGRKQVIQWLLHMEQSSQQRDPVLAAYDFGWLWDELGISRLEKPI
jgi:hypothetical protein